MTAGTAHRHNERMAQTTSQWNAAVGTGIVRLAAGSGLVATAGFSARLLGAERDDSLVPNVLMGLGARDLALGLLALASTRPGGRVGRAIAAQAAFDVVDAGVVLGLIAGGRIRRLQGGGAVALALVTGAMDAAVARYASRPPGLSLTG